MSRDIKGQKKRIVFMGTPEFAVPSLEILLKNGYDVVGVITSPDKFGGRGRKHKMVSTVKRFAQGHGLHILQPKNLKAASFNEELRALKPDLQVVVAFRMLPEVVWALPPLGTINLHGSLLPRYRGAAPINWAVINGEKETGLTTFFIQHAIDTGDLLYQKSISILPDDTAGSLHDRMMHSGAELVLKTVENVFAGSYETQVQDESLVSKAPKLKHEMCELSLSQSAYRARNFIRGLNPWPVAWITWKEGVLKIYDANISQIELEVGQVLLHDGELLLGTNTRALSVKEVQLSGRKRMKINDFLNGNPDVPHLVERSKNHLL